MIEAIVVGGGPAGLAVANSLQEAGIQVVVYEKGALADAISRFPYYMKWFSTAVNLELADYPLIITDEKPNREEYLNYLRRFTVNKNLQVVTHHEVRNVESHPDGTFVVRGANRWDEPFEERARYVVVANGAFDHPQLLGVPGEGLPKVSHYYNEVHPFVGTKVAVVGGKSSAVETALQLFRAGAEVTLIHRGSKVGPVKYWLQPDIENRIKTGEIKSFLNSTVHEILKYDIVIKTQSGELVTEPNDFVLAMTGYQPDVAFLHSMGITIDPVSKRPFHDPETLESNVPGLFVAGVIVAGNISNEVFIENSRHHGELILKSIQAKQKQRNAVTAR